MLKIKAEISNQGEYRLVMKGHCNYDVAGKDIICSAASILATTLAQVIKENEKKDMFETKPKVKLNNGRANIFFKPKAGREKQFEIVMLTVITGFRVLEHQYPKHIKVN